MQNRRPSSHGALLAEAFLPSRNGDKPMGKTAKIEIDGKVHEFPIVEGSRIYRPRQIYVGPTLNHYVPMGKRAGETR